MMTVQLRRALQREAGPHYSEQGIILCAFHIFSSSHMTALSSSAQLHYSRFRFQPPILSLPVSHSALHRTQLLLVVPILPIIPSVFHILPHSVSIVPSPTSLQPAEDFMIVLNDRWAALDSTYLTGMLFILFWVCVHMFPVLWPDVGTDQVRPTRCWRCLCSWVGHTSRDMINNGVYFGCIWDMK